MAGFDIESEGMPELERLCKALPVKLQRVVLRPALREGAKVVRQHVRVHAPKSDRAPHTADTLKIKASKRKRNRIGYVVITGKRDVLGIRDFNAAEVAVVDKYRADRAAGKKVKSPRIGPGYYPAHIEYGYRKADGTHVPANPFMKRALNAARGPAMAAITAEMNKRMKALAGAPDMSDADFYAETDGGEVF